MGLSTEISTLRPLTSTNNRVLPPSRPQLHELAHHGGRQTGVAGRSRSGNSSASSWRALGVHHSKPAGAIGRQQESAGGVERGARARRDARVGEMHADARQQFVDDQRLGDVVHAAGGQTFEHVLGFGEARHEDHRQVRRTSCCASCAGRFRSR